MSSACRGVRVLPRGGRPREKTRADANGREASGGERRKGRPPGGLLPGSPPRLLDRASRSATLHSMTWPGPKALSGDRGPDSGRRLRPQEETADGAEIRHGASRTRTGDLLGCDSCAWMAELWLELSASRDLRFSFPNHFPDSLWRVSHKDNSRRAPVNSYLRSNVSVAPRARAACPTVTGPIMRRALAPPVGTGAARPGRVGRSRSSPPALRSRRHADRRVARTRPAASPRRRGRGAGRRGRAP
jgi:hypothetical protein